MRIKAKEYSEKERVIHVRQRFVNGRAQSLYEWCHPRTMEPHGTCGKEYVTFTSEVDAIDAALRFGYAVNKTTSRRTMYGKKRTK